MKILGTGMSAKGRGFFFVQWPVVASRYIAALILALMAGITPGYAQVITNYSESNASAIQEISLANSTLSSAPTGPGSNTYDYVVIEGVVVSASGSYTFSQSSAPIDTVMILYDGAFDPSQPQNNVLGHNDDTPGAGTCRGSTNLCPSITVTLTAGQTVFVVISTYNHTSTLSVPLGFTADGPGSVAFSTPAVAAPAAAPQEQDKGKDKGRDIKSEVSKIVTSSSQNILRGRINATRNMVLEARDRFIGSLRPQSSDNVSLATRNHIPLDIDGTFNYAEGALNTQGTFFGQVGDFDGTQRRLLFGDFTVQRDGDGATTGTFSARVAWESMVRSDTMFGYFVGGDLSRSNVNGNFDGDISEISLDFGTYVVHEVRRNLIADAYFSVGAGRNDLELRNNASNLDSDYATQSVQAGASLSGVIPHNWYELRPELSFSYGRTWIGDVDFTGNGEGLTNGALRLDAGTASIIDVLIRPEVRIPLEFNSGVGRESLISLSPRLLCEQLRGVTRTDTCAMGAEISLSSLSAEGLSSAEIKFTYDDIKGGRKSIEFDFQHRF